MLPSTCSDSDGRVLCIAFELTTSSLPTFISLIDSELKKLLRLELILNNPNPNPKLFFIVHYATVSNQYGVVVPEYVFRPDEPCPSMLSMFVNQLNPQGGFIRNGLRNIVQQPIRELQVIHRNRSQARQALKDQRRIDAESRTIRQLNIPFNPPEPSKSSLHNARNTLKLCLQTMLLSLRVKEHAMQELLLEDRPRVSFGMSLSLNVQ